MTPTFRRACALLAIAAQAGCRTTVPEQVLTKPVPAITAAASRPDRGPWEPHPNGVASSYAIVQAATVRMEEDSSVRVDSVASRTDVFLAVSPAGQFAGTVTAFRTRGSGQLFATPPGVTLPVTFSGSITAAGTAQLTLPEPSPSCVSAATTVVLSSRDLWLRLPDTVRLGATWHDASATVICRDGIPLRMSARRSYHVERADTTGGDVAVVVVARSQQLVLDGSGTQWGEHVRVYGTGTGDMMLRVSARTGTVLDANGQSMLELTFTSTRTVQRVRQQGETSIRLVATK